MRSLMEGMQIKKKTQGQSGPSQIPRAKIDQRNIKVQEEGGGEGKGGGGEGKGGGREGEERRITQRHTWRMKMLQCYRGQVNGEFQRGNYWQFLESETKILAFKTP